MAASSSLRMTGPHQAAATTQQLQLQLPHQHKQRPASYLVSLQNQHVLPAAAGEVQPLRLGRNLELQVIRRHHMSIKVLYSVVAAT
jgi:hypothetical protein